nr:relaxin receptor 1-like [Lytechinus pictus]
MVNACALPYYPELCRCNKLTQLDCSNLSFTLIPSDIPSNVTRLFLTYNNIERIDSASFSRFPSLVYLNLMGNQLRKIQAKSFQHLHHLSTLYLSENKISVIEREAFLGLHGLHWLFLNGNKLTSLLPGIFTGLERLYWLDLRHNEIRDLNHGTALKDLLSVAWIDFEGNGIQSIEVDSFPGNTSLTVLVLKNNSISSIEENAFKYQETLMELDLSNNEISHLPLGVFNHLHQLQILRLQNNSMMSLPTGVFDELQNLIDLDLGGITITDINVEMFEDLTKLEKLAFAKFEYCRYAPHVRTCTPRSDGISSFENLLKNVILRVFVWTIGIITSVGNLGVLVSRAFMKAENKVHTVVVINLCTADFLMGLYLLIIGTQDVKYRNKYNQYALEWTNGVTCKVSGLLAMISSEVSVLTLMFISLERYFIIVYPYSFQRIKTRRAIMVLACIWCFGTLLAVFPMIPVEYFGNFYGSNGVCFPLHLHDPRMQGWEYSAFLFLGINTTTFFVIVVSYTAMFLSIRRTRRAAAQCGVKDDMAYAKRFFFIILTDSLCWLPIAILKIMSLYNYIISETLYGWIVVFVLPINSALNPILYTVSTTTFSTWFMRQMKRCTAKRSEGYIDISLAQSNGREPSRDITTYSDIRGSLSLACPKTTTVRFSDSSCSEISPALVTSI